jgi:repressor LexA
VIFGERLKQLREKRGLRQQDVADQVGVARVTISLYEAGRREPDNETIERLADLFQVSVDYLFGRMDMPNGLPPGAVLVTEFQRIPIVGVIRAGTPILAQENIEGWRYIPSDLAKGGELFYLRVKGDSMQGTQNPIADGHLVLVRTQPEVENGEIAVVMVNGDEATLKRVHVQNNTLILTADNSKYPPIIVGSEDVRIIGKVISGSYDVR